ncbi:GTP-binding protein [Athelia psychrophila]|uniref:GTP-binding protein n=1 Tax=Athelia psychrophila TaxID=1759441 RepID=A0A166PF47_9AGAM|nr:GTP-binding protein [Fibularhizoctonia sp. CBS 109695]
MNNPPDNTETQGSNLRLRCPYFRILVMGRSNAGKTTILKKVCNSVDDPLIFSPSGEQIDSSVVAPSAERGYHDINNEMIFKSNPNFIFHDSRGFECGSVDETETVQRFLSERAHAGELKNQLHAVWYCLPTDTARPILAADETFFNGCGIGKAPVIVIFTKFDGLVTMAFNELRGHLSIKDARKQASAAAVIKLDDLFKKPLQASKFPPTTCLYLKDMQRGNTTCSELIEATANAITDDALKGLFISVQQSNIELCIHYALEMW